MSWRRFRLHTRDAVADKVALGARWFDAERKALELGVPNDEAGVLGLGRGDRSHREFGGAVCAFRFLALGHHPVISWFRLPDTSMNHNARKIKEMSPQDTLTQTQA